MAHAIDVTQPRKIILGWRSVLALAALVIGTIWALGFLQDILRYAAGAGPDSMVWIFDVDSEEGLLTWVSIVLLFTVSVVLFGIGQQSLQDRDGPVLPWFGLSLLFGMVSFDEFYGLHERLSRVVDQTIGGSGVFHFAWVIPFGLLAVLGLGLLVPFLRSLGRRTLHLALASAALYLCGAVGMEMLAGLVVEEQGQQVFIYRLLTNLEEGLEVGGVLLFIYTLQRHRYAPREA